LEKTQKIGEQKFGPKFCLLRFIQKQRSWVMGLGAAGLSRL